MEKEGGSVGQDIIIITRRPPLSQVASREGRFMLRSSLCSFLYIAPGGLFSDFFVASKLELGCKVLENDQAVRVVHAFNPSPWTLEASGSLISRTTRAPQRNPHAGEELAGGCSLWTLILADFFQV